MRLYKSSIWSPGCWARAANGHATAVMERTPINFRLFMESSFRLTGTRKCGPEEWCDDHWNSTGKALPERRPRRFPASFDHLVGAGQKSGGYSEPVRFRCLQIDDHFELARTLHREFGGFCTFEDLVDVLGGTRIVRFQKRTIG